MKIQKPDKSPNGRTGNREKRMTEKKGGKESAYQDQFLDRLKKKRAPVFIYLISGIKLTGIIKDFDTYTINLDYEGQ